jgi:hypothetical protein
VRYIIVMVRWTGHVESTKELRKLCGIQSETFWEEKASYKVIDSYRLSEDESIIR